MRAQDVPDLDVVRGERGGGLEEERARPVGGPPALVVGVEEPVAEELELELVEPVVVEDRAHARRASASRAVLEVGVPEPDAAEADARRLLAALAKVEEAPLAPEVHLHRARRGPVEGEQVVARAHQRRNLTCAPLRSQFLPLAAQDGAEYDAASNRPRRAGTWLTTSSSEPGTAGCVLAGRLSEDPDTSVLLLEAGPPDTAHELHVPALFPVVISRASTGTCSARRSRASAAAASTYRAAA